jgi:hypothetical protein
MFDKKHIREVFKLRCSDPIFILNSVTEVSNEYV